jgi:hypothetical protein
VVEVVSTAAVEAASTVVVADTVDTAKFQR